MPTFTSTKRQTLDEIAKEAGTTTEALMSANKNLSTTGTYGSGVNFNIPDTPTPIKDNYYPRSTDVATPTTPAVIAPQSDSSIYEAYKAKGILPGGYSPILENNMTVGMKTPTGEYRASGSIPGVSPGVERTITAPKKLDDYYSEAYKTMFPKYSAAIDAITQGYQQKIEEAQRRGVQMQGATRAQGAAMGLIGSGEQATAQAETGRATEATVGRLMTTRNLEIADVMDKVNTTAIELAKAQASQDQDAAQNAILLKDKARATAKESAMTLSKSGITVDDLSSKTPDTYKALLDSFDGDENLLRATFALNRPEKTILDTKTIGSTLYQTSKDPVTGKVVTEHFDLGYTPPTEWKTEKLGTNSVIFYDPKDPNNSIIKSYGGGPGGTTTANSKESKLLQYQIDRADRIMGQVDQALQNVNGFTAGYGGLLAFLPETEARTLSKQVESIKANIGFNELQAMRAASPTGGALGQVAVQELDFLQSVLGSLDTKQAPEQLVRNLNAVKTHYQNWKATIAQAERQGLLPSQGQQETGQAQYVQYNGQVYQVDADGNMTLVEQ